jgi:hypothetical protein
MLDQTALAEFKTSLAGELIQPGENGYDEARQVYNGMIDRRPRLIALCRRRRRYRRGQFWP